MPEITDMALLMLSGAGGSSGGSAVPTGSSVIWATDPDAASPFGYTSLQTTPQDSGWGSGSYTLTSVYDSDYDGNLLALTHSDSGQITVGGVLGGSVIDNIFTDLGSGDMYIRWLFKFEAGFWDNWTDEGFGWEWKWLDFGDNGTSRVIPKIKQPSHSGDGAMYFRIDPGYEYQTWDSPTSADQFTEDTLVYLEMGLLSNGTLRVWLADYDGTDTEYTEGSTYIDTGSGAHSWNPSLVSGAERPITTFINHQDDTTKTVRYHMAINDSFIGPGPVTSTY